MCNKHGHRANDCPSKGYDKKKYDQEEKLATNVLDW